MNDTIISVFYGTADPDFITNPSKPVIPTYNTQKIYEYGIGFYVTPSKNTAKQYAITKSIDEKISLPTEKLSINDFKNFSSNTYIHEFKVNLNTLKSLQGLEIDNSDTVTFKNELLTTIKMYRKNGLVTGYSPNRHYTFGPLCGSYWDEYWDKNTFPNDVNSFVNKCILHMSEERQLCIHKESIGTDPETKNLKGFEYSKKHTITL